MFMPLTSATSGNLTELASLTGNASSNDSSSFAMLSGTCGRNRAIENDYSDHPIDQRTPSSTINETRALLPEPSRQRERLQGRDVTHSARPQRLGDRRRHQPGSAKRVGSLPVHLASRGSSVTRETRLSNRDDQPHQSRPTPTIPPRLYPHTMGHLPSRTWGFSDLSRRVPRSRPAPPTPSHVCDIPITSIPSNSSAPPARPPPPSAEVAARLGVPTSHDRDDLVVPDVGVRTSQPISRLSTDCTQRVVSAQPTTTKSDSLTKSVQLVVDLKEEKQSKTTCDRRSGQKVASELSKKSSTNSSLKKNPDLDPILIGADDDDHQMLGPGSGLDSARASIKPGDHNYPCPRCGKCMCARCQGDASAATAATQRPAAHCWMCNHRCLCDVDSCVEAATCLCCVRACFYHCSNYEDNEACTDKPCSCHGTNCCLRWSALGALSIFLPCLLCYPVARGCVGACRSCADCMRPGCRCKESYR